MPYKCSFFASSSVSSSAAASFVLAIVLMTDKINMCWSLRPTSQAGRLAGRQAVRWCDGGGGGGRVGNRVTVCWCIAPFSALPGGDKLQFETDVPFP